MAPKPPAPVAQGELDGLCGLYSIVNAIQWILHTSAFTNGFGQRPRQLSTRNQQALFDLLVTALSTRRSPATFMTGGISSLELTRLLRIGRDWLQKHRNAGLALHRPFYRHRTIAAARVVDLLARHLSAPGSAAIVGFEPPLLHWTVITGLSAKRIRLHDSGSRVCLSMTSIDYRGADRPNGVKPRNIFLLRLSAPANAQAARP